MSEESSMRVTYYGYNAFTIEADNLLVIIDPGMNLDWKHLRSLVPPELWKSASHVMVTHGDADHAQYAGQVARVAKAPIICGQALAGRWLRTGVEVHCVSSGERCEIGGLKVVGVPVQHGPVLRIRDHHVSVKPPRIGVGAVGFLIMIGNRSILNLGDTVLLEEVWAGMEPELLMVPTGGIMTMNVDQALTAVDVIQPKVVIPMHHNWHLLFYHHRADMSKFNNEVQARGLSCFVLDPGESMNL
jgi:L-ascorbate metabolism protein UlaG (beta-lactamase superfamily)